MRKSQSVILLLSVLLYCCGVVSNVLFHNFIPNYEGKIGYVREAMIEIVVFAFAITLSVTYLARRDVNLEKIWVPNGKAWVGVFWLTVLAFVLIISVMPP